MTEKVTFGRGATVNAARFCAMLGWTRPTFARWVAEGLPVKRAPRNRGGEYEILTGEALEWLFDYGARGNGRRASGPAREPEGPPLGPGMEMLQGVTDRTGIAFTLGVLTVLYDLPRLTAVFAVEAGIPMGKAFELSWLLPLAVLTSVHGHAGGLGLEPWTRDVDDLPVNDEAFSRTNWPNLARKAGEPGWQPPRYGLGGHELSAAERAACVRPGEAEDARHAAELAAEEGTAAGTVVA